MCEGVWYVNTSQEAPLTLFSGQSSETSVGPQRAVSFFFSWPALILLLICHVPGGGNQWLSVLVGQPPFLLLARRGVSACKLCTGNTHAWGLQSCHQPSKPFKERGDAKSWAVHDCARTGHLMGVSWDG